LNSALLEALRHGRLAARPGIERYAGHTVHFTDGTHEDFWRLADHQSRIAALQLSGRLNRPPDIDTRIHREVAHPRQHVEPSPRHAIEVDYHTFRRELLNELSRGSPSARWLRARSQERANGSGSTCRMTRQTLFTRWAGKKSSERRMRNAAGYGSMSRPDRMTRHRDPP
jgi:hypothetical protein